MNSNATLGASSKYKLKHNPSVFACAQELVAQIVGLA